MTFNVAERTVTVPLATMEAASGKFLTPGGLIGEHFSYKWKYSAGGLSDNRTNITVSVGLIAATGRRFIRYEVMADYNDRAAIRFETMFQY